MKFFLKIYDLDYKRRVLEWYLLVFGSVGMINYTQGPQFAYLQNSIITMLLFVLASQDHCKVTAGKLL